MPPSPGAGSAPYGKIVNNFTPQSPTGIVGSDPVQLATLWTTEAIQFPYEHYEVRTFYSYDRGIVKMPVAAPDGTPAAIVKVCAAHGTKVIAYAASRKVNKPALPALEPDSANQVFKFEHHENRALQSEPDGATLFYSFAGFYVYELLTPLSPNVNPGDTLNFAQPPTFTGDVTMNRLRNDDFVTGITVE